MTVQMQAIIYSDMGSLVSSLEGIIILSINMI